MTRGTDRGAELLGKVLAHPRIATEAVLALETDWLATEAQRVVHRAMVELVREQRAPTGESVAARVQATLQPESVCELFPKGLPESIAAVRDLGARTNAHDWPDALSDTHAEHNRRRIRTSLDAISARIGSATSPSEVFDVASSGIIAATMGHSDDPLVVENEMGMAQWLCSRTGDVEPPKTWRWPFPSWNSRRLLEESKIVVIGAPSGAGKSLLGIQFLEIACRADTRVALFSMEMSEPEQRERLIMQGPIHESMIASESFNMDAIADRVNEILKYDYTVFEGSTSFKRIQSAVLRAKAMQRPYGMLIIDHLHLVDVAGGESYRLSLNNLLAGLRALANTERMPIILLAQLSRPPKDAGKDYRPRMTDLRDSGAIEQIADYAFLLKRNEVEDGQEESPEGRIWCDKRRGGRRFPMIPVLLSPQKNRFVELHPQWGVEVPS